MLSWILDLVLSSIPSWIWLVSAASGLLIFFFTGILGYFTSIGPYIRFAKPVAGLTTLLCVFMYGGSGVQSMWEEKVKAEQEKVKLAEQKVKLAEEASADANKKLDEERKKKQKIITKYIDRIKEQIVVKREVIDAKCEVAPEAIEILNNAAKLNEALQSKDEK